MTGAELFVDCLRAGGVDTVFALPGEETVDLMDALAQSDIHIIMCRHEQSAAFMASIHGRLTGRPAACLATLGPGATNLVTGVADATLDLAPMIAISGQGARERVADGKNSHQIIDLERLFEPVTKRSRMIWTASEIPVAVAEAIEVCKSPRPGAVHISLPEDLAAEVVAGAPRVAPDTFAAIASADAIAATALRLSEADRPIVLAGGGVLRGGASDQLGQFLDGTGIPLATSFMAKGLLPADHPQNLGAFGLPTDDHVDRAIADADLVLTVGLDPVEYPLRKLSDDGAIPVVALNEVSLTAGSGWSPSLEVSGALIDTLRALSASFEARRWPVWPAAQEARDALAEDLSQARKRLDQKAPDATALSVAVSDALGADDLLISGVGTHKLALARNMMPKRAGQVVIGNGLAGMGLALPGAIAAARLDRYARVLAVCGDGEIMMNVQEMETATRLDLEMTLVVCVDDGFGLIEDKQESNTGTRPDLSFAALDWGQLAGAFSWTHTPCDTADELRSELQRAAPEKRRLITVPVTYDGTLA